MKLSKALIYFAALILLTMGAVKLTLYLEEAPGGINGVFDELGIFNVVVLFCLPLMAVVFSVYPPLMYPFVVIGYPFMWLWRKIKGGR
ncbi:hypothetical protein A3759_00530 [Thalassolituus sp. HI0120]|nr:hypothetical protein A3759_00530 [Thalassolituus sp. HI0120]